MTHGEARTSIFRQTIAQVKTGRRKFLFVFHLSKNNEPYLLEWIRRFPHLGVISIPYSENPEVVRAVQRQTKLHRPRLRDIPGCIQDICSKHPKENIILVEIGGYSAGIAKRLSNVVLAVEDTNQGHWNFETHAAELTYPVVSMARTSLKHLENNLIGRSVVYSVETILRTYFNLEYLVGKHVLVISYGGIGSATCHALRALGSRVTVHDTDPIKMSQAFVDGYTIGSKAKGLAQADIVIGCTGRQSVGLEDLSGLKPGALLVSGSSRQIEFPYAELRKHVIARSPDGVIEYVEFRGKKFSLAYQAQPVNFLYDSSLGKIFDIQMALLFQCVRFGLERKLENRVYDLPPDYQAPIAELFVKEVLRRSA